MTANLDFETPGAAPQEVRLGAGTAYGLAAQVINLGTSFLVGILVARLLGPQGKGMLSVVLQVPAILAIVLNFGVSSAYAYYVGRDELAPGTALGNSIVLCVAAGVIAAPITLVLLQGRAAVVQGVPPIATGLAILALPLGLFASWLVGISTGLADLRMPLLYAVASSATTLVGIGGLFLAHEVTLDAVVAASIGGSAVGFAVMLVGMSRRIRPVRVELAAARKTVRYSMQAYLGSIAAYLGNRQDVLLLGWLAGSSAVGLYSVGVSFAELLWYVPSALGSAILAKSLRSSDASALDFVARSSRISMLITALGALVALPLVPLLIRVLYGGAFGGSTWAFLCLVPGVFALGTVRIVWYFQAARDRIYWRQAFAGTVLNVVLNLLFVPRLGFVGAAIASTLSYTTLAVILMRLFVRDTGVSAKDMLLPRRDDAVIAARTIGRMAGFGSRTASES